MTNEAFNNIIEHTTVDMAMSLIEHELLVQHARGEDPSIPRAAAGAVMALVSALSGHGYSVEDSLLMLKNISNIPPADLGA